MWWAPERVCVCVSYRTQGEEEEEQEDSLRPVPCGRRPRFVHDGRDDGRAVAACAHARAMRDVHWHRGPAAAVVVVAVVAVMAVVVAMAVSAHGDVRLVVVVFAPGLAETHPIGRLVARLGGDIGGFGGDAAHLD